MADKTRKFVDHLLTFFDDVEVAVGATDFAYYKEYERKHGGSRMAKEPNSLE